MSKKFETKTPLWKSILKGGVFTVFIGYVIVPDNYFVAHLAVWALTFWAGVLGILLGISLGVASIVSRRKAAMKEEAEENSTSSVSASA